MENNVIISIQGKQSFEAQDDDTIELVTEGCLEPDGDDGYTLSYQESELTGLEGTLTTFQIERDRVTLLRVGEVNSQMVFEEGRRHLSMYDTPYGALSVGINTRKMRAELDARGGSIEIDYAIEIDHALAGQNLFRIHVREKGPAIKQSLSRAAAGCAAHREMNRKGDRTMSNMIQAAREQVAALTQAAYEKAAAEGLLPAGAEVKATIEIPKDVTHGDYASSFAMAGAKALRKAPRQIAEVIVSHLDLAGTFFDKVEVAGPVFLNFTLGSKWYGGVLADIQAEGESYGAVDEGRGEKVMVEFVSANPTGPMHIGNARGGVLGDALAAVLERAGYDVWREFYVNDAGNQIHKFAMSIDARYLQLVLGEENVPFPEDGYHGDDIKELARGFYDQHGAGWKDKSEEERQAAMAEYGLSVNIPKMKEDLRRYKIEYDEWFLESSLHNSGYVAETVGLLAGKGWTYEKDGALWLNTTALLKQKFLAEGKSQEQVDKLDLKDDVLRRANGFYTYFAADIAYHRNKLEQRGFSKAINIWGADHHGHVARLQAALDGLGLDGSHRLIIVLMQLVNLLQDGQPVRMSKRSGKAIALRDLLDEVSVDAARFFFNSRSSTSALDFDLDLAVREDSENPVYYVQYAHARICSLIARLAEEGHLVPDAAAVDPALYATAEEKTLIKTLSQLPEVIRLAARDYDPSGVNRYLVTLAGEFHRFYNACRIKGEEAAVLAARLKLADTVRAVIANCLSLIGVAAPEKM